MSETIGVRSKHNSSEELALLIKGGKHEYIPELWERVYRLIYKWAMKYYDSNNGNSKYSIDDLVQSGYFAVLNSLNDYTEAKGYKFTTLESLTVIGRNIIRCYFWNNMTFTDIERAYNIPLKDIMKEYRTAMRDLRSRSNMTILNKYKDDISNNYYPCSLSSWRETGTSSTEREAINNIKNETIKLMNSIALNYDCTSGS